VATLRRGVHPPLPAADATDALELGPLETADYVPLVGRRAEAGRYQETSTSLISRNATRGAEKHYAWRLDRRSAARRRIPPPGIGAAFGLHDWCSSRGLAPTRAICWRIAGIATSPSRCRACARRRALRRSRRKMFWATRARATPVRIASAAATGGDRALDARAGEVARRLGTLGVTHLSAGSSTEPGGYSHFDDRQWTPTRRAPRASNSTSPTNARRKSSPPCCRQRGLDPVWKDHDLALTQPTVTARVWKRDVASNAPTIWPTQNQELGTKTKALDSINHANGQKKFRARGLPLPEFLAGCASCPARVVERNGAALTPDGAARRCWRGRPPRIVRLVPGVRRILTRPNTENTEGLFSLFHFPL